MLSPSAARSWKKEEQEINVIMRERFIGKGFKSFAFRVGKKASFHLSVIDRIS